jgi:hypothetical protein
MSQKEFTRARTAAMEALLADVDIQAFAVAHFSKRLNVFRELDPEDLPEDHYCPFVAFGPFTHGQAKGNQHAIEHAMPMGVFLNKSGGYESDGNGGFTLPSSDILDELAGMVEAVVSPALLEAGFPFDQDEAADPDGVDWSRYFYCFYTYRVRTTRRINL